MNYASRPRQLVYRLQVMLQGLYCACLSEVISGKREGDREIHYVHSASRAYEDGIVFMSEPSAARQGKGMRRISPTSVVWHLTTRV